MSSFIATSFQRFVITSINIWYPLIKAFYKAQVKIWISTDYWILLNSSTYHQYPQNISIYCVLPIGHHCAPTHISLNNLTFLEKYVLVNFCNEKVKVRIRMSDLHRKSCKISYFSPHFDISSSWIRLMADGHKNEFRHWFPILLDSDNIRSNSCSRCVWDVGHLTNFLDSRPHAVSSPATKNF